MNVELHVVGDVPRTEAEKARRRFEKLERYMDGQPISARLTLRHQAPGARRPYVADAVVVVKNGRALRAHATGESPSKAADNATDRVERQLRRAVGAEVARRNEPDEIAKAIEEMERSRYLPELVVKPPRERHVSRRERYSSEPKGIAEAIADLIDADEEFHPFVDERTGDEVLAYRRDDGRMGLLVPPGSNVAVDDEIAVVEEMRVDWPLTMDEARREIEERELRFLFFVDAEDFRAKVLYLRHDGDYGLLEPV